MTSLPPEIIAGLVTAPLVALAGWWGWRRWRTHVERRTQLRAVQSIAFDSLRNVLVPDGSGGTLHVDFVLLTSRGVLVVDFRDIAGVIFGSEHMNDWTVMDDAHRSTFPNPLGPLFDRIAAVKLVTGERDVEGRVVFTDRSRFPKGRPPQVLLLSSLQAEFPVADRAAGGAAVEHWRQGWERLKGQCAPSPLGRR